VVFLNMRIGENTSFELGELELHPNIKVSESEKKKEEKYRVNVNHYYTAFTFWFGIFIPKQLFYFHSKQLYYTFCTIFLCVLYFL